MTNTSSIVKDVKRFHSGEVIKDRSLGYYIRKVIKNYDYYQNGVRGIVRHYEYSKYYDRQFVALWLV